MHRRSLGPAARLASDTAGLRAILGRRCGALNDRAPRSPLKPMIRGGRGDLSRRRALSQVKFAQIWRCPSIRQQLDTGRAARPPKRSGPYRKAADASQSPDNLLLIYLVELDVVAEEQAVEPGAFPPMRT